MTPSSGPYPPEGPPSAFMRAAQERLLGRLEGSEGPLEEEFGATDASSFAPESRYEFGELLATGGLGLVRRAFDRRLGRTVAVKELQRNDPASERRFLFEAAITARLQHPGIVPIHDMGRFPGGAPYYCMKLVEGRTLAQTIADANSDEARLRLLEHVLAAADAVAYAHGQSVIHRDLKPANILVGAFGETVVIDWGLAKDLGDEPQEPDVAVSAGSAPGSTLTDVGVIVGTLRYMPPEQARGEAVDRRSDVFTLGAVLFHVLVGRAPHEGLARTTILARLTGDEIEDPRPLAGAAPLALLAIARKAMQPRPSDRYADAGAFADDLRRFLAGRLVDAHHYQARELVRVWVGRHRPVIAVGAAAALTLLVASALFLDNLRGERDLASAAQGRAETAEALALRRADAAVLAQARGALAEDLVGALETLRGVELIDDTRLRSARLTALAAEARGAPDRVLRGHARAIEQLAVLSDGKLVSVDIGGEVRRWDPRTGHGEVVVDLGAGHGQVVAAAEAPVWAALAEDRGYVIRGDEPPEAISLGPLDVGAYNTHGWEVSRHGDVLAALGERHTFKRQFAAAYTWELNSRPAFMRTSPFDQTTQAVLSPDGTMIATSDEQRNAILIEGESVTPFPALKRPLHFSGSGRYLLGTSGERPQALVSVSLADHSKRAIDGSVVAMAPEDHALMLEDDPTVAMLLKRERLVLRSLVTGEARWVADLEVTREVQLALRGQRGGFVVGQRHFGLQVGQQWQIWSMSTGEREHTLDTGPHRRGVFLADGSFAVARHTDVWTWTSLPSPMPDYTAPALAPDGSHAVANLWQAQVPRLIRLADHRQTELACLAGVNLSQLAEVGHRLAVDNRGRALFVDDGGRVCLDGEEGSRRITVPALATAGALAASGETYVVGLIDGAVLMGEGAGAPTEQWKLGAALHGLWVVGDGAAIIAQTRAGAVVGLKAGSATGVTLGTSAPDKNAHGVRVVMHPLGTGAAVLLGDEDAVVFFATGGESERRPVQLSVEPAAAYSASGQRFAVGLARRSVLLLEHATDVGQELALPEEARALAFIGEHELAVVGSSGALYRVDRVLGEAVLLQRGEARQLWPPTEVIARPDGATWISNRQALEMRAPDRVPNDRAGIPRGFVRAHGDLRGVGDHIRPRVRNSLRSLPRACSCSWRMRSRDRP